MRQHYLAHGVGHYGVFNGSRFRSEIQPRIADFIAKHHGKRAGNGHARATTPAKSNGARKRISA